MVTSRVGRKPVTIPAGVDVKMQGQNLIVKGPKGQVTMSVHPYVGLQIADGHISVQATANKEYRQPGAGTKLDRSIAGTTRAKINSIVQGVSQGFERKLVLIGVGYRAQAKGKILGLTLGFSHPVNYSIPEGITIETPSQTEVVIKGMDKELVGHVAATIRAIRPPELYKGKGVRYAGEIIILKETKKK